MILLAGTPLGNDDDASVRLRLALENADLIAAEDTRRLLNLAGRLGVKISAPVIPYHEHNEATQTQRLVEEAQSGKLVTLVTDAGMPAVSDPGYRLVAAASEAGVKVSAAPGPSAAITALAVSGLPSDRFAFEGFPPRKAGEKEKWLAALADEPRTLIFYESPRRTRETLRAMAGAFGASRRAALCRELTKVHEEVRRAPLGELAAGEEEILGEVCIVVEGTQAGPGAYAEVGEQAVAEVLQLHALGLRLKDAAAHVAGRTGLRKNELFKAALAQQE